MKKRKIKPPNLIIVPSTQDLPFIETSNSNIHYTLCSDPECFTNCLSKLFTPQRAQNDTNAAASSEGNTEIYLGQSKYRTPFPPLLKRCEFRGSTQLSIVTVSFPG